MDAKYPSNLDPKLREAYDRVMGTGPAKEAKPVEQKEPPPPAPPKEDPKPAAQHVQPHPAHEEKTTVVHFGADTEKHKKEKKGEETDDTAHSSAKSPVTAILLGVIGALFFIGYALFWAQIFGFNILPSS